MKQYVLFLLCMLFVISISCSKDPAEEPTVKDNAICVIQKRNMKSYLYDDNNRLLESSCMSEYGLYNTKELYVYNEKGLLQETRYLSVNFAGDTLEYPVCLKKFEYNNGQLARIISGVITDSIRYENDRITEFRYFYVNNGAVDHSRTRIIRFEYDHSGNVVHFTYKRLSDNYVYMDDYYEYDSSVNPYYHNVLGLNEKGLFYYCSRNNWIKVTGTGKYSNSGNRNIIYNELDYPSLFSTSYTNGGLEIDSIAYRTISAL